MAGANYMGGKRNYARSKSKDVTGRAQKSHFMRQKHNILTQALRNDRNMDDLKEQRGNFSGRINCEISLAHAKKRLEQDVQNLRSPPLRNTAVQTLLPSASPGFSKEDRLRDSKILEDLDINEPTGLRATVRRVLSQPDLAGLNYSNIGSSYAEQPSFISRKRRKLYEPSSSNVTSLQHRSPVKKRTADFRRPDLPPSDDHSSNSTLISSVASSVLAEKSDTANSSFGSSLDRLAALRGSEPRSTYSDSDFSELHFSDSGKEQARPETPCAIGSDLRTGNAFSSFEKSGSSTNDSVQFQERQTADIKLQENVETVHPTPSRPAQPSTYDDDQSPSTYSLNNFLVEDGPAKSRSQSYSSNKAESDLSSDAGEVKRYGVGYVPQNSGVEYKPFVPLTTMLPSYSDEDCDDTAAEPREGTGLIPRETMVIDDPVKNRLQSETPSSSLGTASISPPAPVSVSISSSHYMPQQACYQTPPRYSDPTTMHKYSSSNRARFSFTVHTQAYTSSVSPDVQDEVSSGPRVKPSAHPRLSTPSVVFKSSSSLVSLQAKDEGHGGVELRRVTERPRYELPSLSLRDVCGATDDRNFSRSMPIIEARPNKSLNDASSNEPNAAIPADNGRPGMSNGCSTLSSPSDFTTRSDGMKHEDNPVDVPSTAKMVDNMPTKVFDGPDLFADGDDEDDED